MELPPRTRRIHGEGRPIDYDNGTTSAHAENTFKKKSQLKRPWNYLRARGEYAGEIKIHHSTKELPPRTRRIPVKISKGLRRVGTTSAHAENTSPPENCSPPERNYLRARGEYAGQRAEKALTEELPPRARRIPPRNEHPSHALGTTSACAENTLPISVFKRFIWNYLRVRGEY